MKRKRSVRAQRAVELHLTERAIADIQAIRDFSIELLRGRLRRRE